MNPGTSNTCAACGADLGASDRFCPKCGHDRQVATIDLGLVGEPPSVDQQTDPSSSEVAVRSSRIPLIVSLAAALALAALAFVLLRPEDPTIGDSGTSAPETSSVADDASINDETNEPRTALEGSEVSSVEAAVAEFPLFPESGRHMIIGRRGDQLVLVDSDTGAVQNLALRSDDGLLAPSSGYSIASVVERLLVADSATVRSFSLAGGADFELSGNVVALDSREGPRVVVASELSGVSSRTVYEVQTYGSYEVFPRESGIIPLNAEVKPLGERVFFQAGGRIFEHQVDIGDDDGFVELSRGTLLGGGRNHIVVDVCDPAFDCRVFLFDSRKRVELQTPVELPARISTPLRVSPDGEWTVQTFGGGVRVSSIDQERQFGLPTTTLLGVSWSNDARYLIASGAGSVSVTDTFTLETTSIDLDGTGQIFDELLVVPAPDGWAPVE